MCNILIIGNPSDSTAFKERLKAEGLAVEILDGGEDGIQVLELCADGDAAEWRGREELVSRIRAILGPEPVGFFSFGHLMKVDDIELNKLKRNVKRGGEEVLLTSAEFDLLEALIKKPGQAVSREDLAQLIFGRQLNFNDRSIDVHVSNLRKKLGRNGVDRDRIRSVRGVGYLYSLS